MTAKRHRRTDPAPILGWAVCHQGSRSSFVFWNSIRRTKAECGTDWWASVESAYGKNPAKVEDERRRWARGEFRFQKVLISPAPKERTR